MGLLHEKYVRATRRHGSTKEASLTPWDYRNPELTINRIGRILMASFRHKAYSPFEQEYLEDAHLVWMHAQRCALFAVGIGLWDDARHFADLAAEAAGALGLNNRLTQFICLLAYKQHEAARDMVNALPAESAQRREMEETFTLCAQREEITQPP